MRPAPTPQESTLFMFDILSSINPVVFALPPSSLAQQLHASLKVAMMRMCHYINSFLLSQRALSGVITNISTGSPTVSTTFLKCIVFIVVSTAYLAKSTASWSVKYCHNISSCGIGLYCPFGCIEATGGNKRVRAYWYSSHWYSNTMVKHKKGQTPLTQ